MSDYDPDLKTLDLPSLRSRARDYFDGSVVPSHDWHHVERVTRLSARLARAEDAHEPTVRVAALLHDVGRPAEDRGEIEDHARWGAREARRLLEDRNQPDSLVRRVTDAIRAHRYSSGPEPRTLEARVLADADNLDALGAIGIARAFSYSGEQNRVLADVDRPPREDSTGAGTTGLNHLVKKILTLRDRLFTRTGREIAGRRHEFVVNFVDRLRSELRGEQ